MTQVTVMWNPFVRSWPQLDDDKPLRPSDRVQVADLGDALEREYRTDAHFTGYVSRTEYRQNVETINEGIEIELTSLVFDVDCAASHRGEGPAPESWRREQRELVVRLADAHPGLFYYETRGGVRFLYTIAEPIILRTQADALEWSRSYHVAVAYFERRFGIKADPACADWQRLYRLPRVTRGNSGIVENWPTWGNEHEISALAISVTRADIEKAKRQGQPAFHEAREFKPTDYHGDGLFFWLLRNRGHVGGKTGRRGGHICLCPNRSAHRTNSDGSNKTVVFPPKPGAELGKISCKRGSCQGLFYKDWLRFFSAPELEQARKSAGIEERKGSRAA